MSHVNVVDARDHLEHARCLLQVVRRSVLTGEAGEGENGQALVIDIIQEKLCLADEALKGSEIEALPVS